VHRRWDNGLLWAFGEREMYPVNGGIPIFVLPPEQSWSPIAVKELQQQKRIRKNWQLDRFQENSVVMEFAKRMAESEGLIIDIASGPGGGFVPLILRKNPEATVLIDDLCLGVLQEWQGFLRTLNIHNTSFALFDARKMPLRSNSLDAVCEIGGFNEIPRSTEAIKEVCRVLKPGGTLFSVDSTIEKGELFGLPESVRTKWYDMNPLSFEGFLDAFKSVGFKVISHSFLAERELSPEEGGLPSEANKYGVRLHQKTCCTEVIKLRVRSPPPLMRTCMLPSRIF